MELNPTRSRHIGSELITFGIKSDQSTFLRTTRGGRVLIPTRNVPSYESLKTNCSNESLKTYRSNESLKTYCSNESLKTCCSNESLKTYPWQLISWGLAPAGDRAGKTRNDLQWRGHKSLKTHCSNESLKTHCSNESLKTNYSNESLKTYCSNESLKTHCSNESLKTNCSNESLKTYCSNESLKTYCSNESLKTYCSNDVHLGSVTTRGLAQIWLRLATGLAMEHGVRKTVCSCTRVVRQRHEVKLALLKASLRTEQYRRSKSLASLSS